MAVDDQSHRILAAPISYVELTMVTLISNSTYQDGVVLGTKLMRKHLGKWCRNRHALKIIIQKTFDFSDPYYETQNAIIVRKDQESTYSSLDAFKGKKVAVQKGAIEEGLAKKQLKDSTVVSLTAMGEAINEVKSGQVDAVDLEKPVAEGYVAQNPDLALASVALKVDDGDAKAVAMAKGNDKLKEAVNKVIKKLKDNGTYDEYIKDASKYTAVE